MSIVRAYGETAELIFSCPRTVLLLCWLQQARHRPADVGLRSRRLEDEPPPPAIALRPSGCCSRPGNDVPWPTERVLNGSNRAYRGRILPLTLGPPQAVSAYRCSSSGVANAMTHHRAGWTVVNHPTSQQIKLPRAEQGIAGSDRPGHVPGMIKTRCVAPRLVRRSDMLVSQGK
jgi:hypothetical protein